MIEPESTIFVEYQTGRETQYTLIATPAALRLFAEALTTALAQLPAPLLASRELPLGAVVAAEADGGKREVYLSVRAEPSLGWLAARRARSSKRDWVIIALLLTATVFAVFGLGTFVHWLLAGRF